ncbi:baculoviral IAP repeat-containing protein 1-like [Mixophyes fleayi]|uniref:baculoviral IAP repeat-containing protein 1-like n=1 Tax=Mixophyes fleayi TaxID=3061075 RepID=UPI003F4E19DC
MDLTNISEFDPSFRPALPPSFMHVDLDKLISEMKETHRKIREQLPKGPNYSMRSEAKRLRSLSDLEPSSTWSPKELASAGFFCTGLENSCQCFCCGLVLCKQSLSATPIENHRKFNPTCGFIQGNDVGNIAKYDVRLQPTEFNTGHHKESMKDEPTRQQSYICWPVYALIEPSVLAQAGFYFIGTRDSVQCFSCGGCLVNWEENDDPWREHAKWFPQCEFLRSKKSEDDIQLYIKNYCRFEGLTSVSFRSILCNQEISLPETANVQLSESLETLKKQLIGKYRDATFHNMSPFGDSVSINLSSLFADIFVVLKDTRNHIVRQLTLPDILSELRDITMIEGEAGSGKTALLRKIAILWASGRCPILSRFSLVFYISLSSTKSQQTLSDIICQQLMGPTSITEEIVGEIINHLKEKALFLLDDYGVMNSVPEAIEELLLKNPWNRLSLAITVSTDKGWMLRQNARTILSIQKFPLYSTIYLVKKLFSHDIERVKAFLVTLETSKNLPAILQTPLVILAQCSSWFQYPSGNTIGDIHAFKAYLKYNTVKFPDETEVVDSHVSSCGELALKGLFQCQFQFTEDDLRAADVESDKAIKCGLLSKFTAQRLQSMYKFFDPSFQEFLAGKRLSELLESEKQEDLEKGFHYLHQINTFLKIIGPYSYFLKYASRISTKATKKILSYLFSLYDSTDALDCHLDSTEHLQRHPELELEESLLINTLRKVIIQDINLYCMNRLMTFAILAAIETHCLPDCAPIVMQFLTGKTMSFSVSPFNVKSSESILTFIEKYPESISLFSCVEFTLNYRNMLRKAPWNVSGMANAYEKYGVPTVEKDYSSAYLSFNKTMQDNQEKSNDSNKIFSLFPQEIVISDSVIRPFKTLMGHKVPIFKLEANDINSGNFSQLNCEKFHIFFSISDHIEIQLNSCRDFVKHIASAIEEFLSSFRKLTIHDTYLAAEEQDLILKMSSLESLQIENAHGTYYPELLIRGIHKFTSLTEVSVVLPENPEVLDHLPDEFQRLNGIKRIIFHSPNCTSVSTRFVQFFQSFADLEVLHLGFGNFLDCNGLMSSLTTCKKLKELNLCGSVLQDNDMALLAQALKDFTSLKFLNLNKQKITGQDISKAFATALGSLIHLEKLWLPVGEGMTHAAKLIIEQFQNLPNLQFLKMTDILDDESILLLAEATNSSYLKNLQQLELQVNANISESGWTTFFERAGNMQELNHLDISRLYTQQIKSHGSTVTSFVRFVSRLPSLVTILMYGWLLDKDDFNMFNTMKQNHPQSKSLNIAWQWYLLSSPIIED